MDEEVNTDEEYDDMDPHMISRSHRLIRNVVRSDGQVFDHVVQVDENEVD